MCEKDFKIVPIQGRSFYGLSYETLCKRYLIFAGVHVNDGAWILAIYDNARTTQPNNVLDFPTLHEALQYVREHYDET